MAIMRVKLVDAGTIVTPGSFALNIPSLWVTRRNKIQRGNSGFNKI